MAESNAGRSDPPCPFHGNGTSDAMPRLKDVVHLRARSVAAKLQECFIALDTAANTNAPGRNPTHMSSSLHELYTLQLHLESADLLPDNSAPIC